MTPPAGASPERLRQVRDLVDTLRQSAGRDDSALKTLFILWLDHTAMITLLNLVVVMAGGRSLDQRGGIVAGMFQRVNPPHAAANIFLTNFARWKNGERSASLDLLGMQEGPGQKLAAVFFSFMTTGAISQTSGSVLGDFRNAIEGIRATLPPMRNAGLLEEADRLEMFWAAVEHQMRSAEDTLVLSPGYFLNVGHCVVAAALVETLRGDGFGPRKVAAIPGRFHNAFLSTRILTRLDPEVPPNHRFGEIADGAKSFFLKDHRLAHVMKLLSEAGRVWSEGRRPFLTLEPEVIERGYAVLAEYGVEPGDRIVTMHVREPGFHAESLAARFRDTEYYGMRNGSIDSYREAIDAVIDNGGVVIRLGDTSMTPLGTRAGFIDYPFTEHKSDWMDIFLASQCHYHLGTASGMSYVPMLFGRPVAFTNYITLVNICDTPNVLTVFKPLFDVDGNIVPFETFATRFPRLANDKELEFHAIYHEISRPEDILEAVQLMERHADRETGLLDLPDSDFEEAQRRFGQSPLRMRPKIPPRFWNHYYGG
ncbi:TIGR04372 family glycosyltransferase [Thalassobaculum salexigens]|uniref:TIGR04372 family glycosyltransferase n=1 Tax=Thalassobaculum salexigens TaxID=455360 RepID=UPI000403AD12|nr:TIGR04372 family glycosyltransferase [Thalassobaculum salexigens]